MQFVSTSSEQIDMTEMVELKKIPYGNAGFLSIRSCDYAYVDKTRFIETLEQAGSRFPFIVRPRRFGKTLFTETLRAYYDKSEADNFEKNFSGTYIGSHRTPLASQYYVLKFTFAGFSSENPEDDFLRTVRNSLYAFFNLYPHPRQNEILDQPYPNAGALIQTFFALLGTEYCQKLFIIIDEYDHLTNVVLYREIEEFKAITSAAGFFKDFYTQLKSATNDTGPVARIFITGVASIALDSITSGFSIATNYTTRSAFSTLFGFTEDELRKLIPEIIDLQKYGRSVDQIIARMKEWYNGYRFSSKGDESVFNASMCLYYLGYIRDENEEPVTLLDPSFSQDLQKISAILGLGDQNFVKSILTTALQHQPIDFPAGDLQLLNINRNDQLDADCILSAMFYMGYLTFAPNDRYKLVIPNRAVAIQFFEYYLQNILSVTGAAGRYTARDLIDAYQALKNGDPEPLFRSASNRFAQQSDSMTSLHLTESDFQTLIAASLYFNNEVMVIREAQAVGPNGGRIDLLIKPSETATGKFSYLVEFKHLTKSEIKSNKNNVHAVAKMALEQARRYANCENIHRIPNLKLVVAVYAGTELSELLVEDFARD